VQRIGIVVIAAAVGCGRPATPRQSAGDAAATAPAVFSFDWPAPCRFEIDEYLSSGDDDDQVNLASVDVAHRGDDFVIGHRGGDALLRRGRAPSGAEQALHQALNKMFAATRFVVSRRGELRSIDLADSLELLAQGPGGYAPKFGTAVLERPELRAYYEESQGHRWHAWVGAWVDWDLAAGQTRRDERVRSVLGRDVIVIETREHLGEEGGLVRLRKTERVNAPLFALVAAIVAESSGEPDAELMAAAATGWEEVVLEVTTDPATLRPRRAKVERRSHGELLGQSVDVTILYIESFDWDAIVEDCGAPER
jgi:hypothetical protein